MSIVEDWDNEHLERLVQHTGHQREEVTVEWDRYHHVVVHLVEILLVDYIQSDCQNHLEIENHLNNSLFFVQK